MMPQTGPDVWRRLEMLFHSASEMDPLERSIFLDEACAGDPELRERLESLLAAADRTFGFIEKPVYQAVRDAIGDGISEGQQIGEYVVVRTLGSGGMGRVYLARRADGQFDQQVAIKQMHAALSPSEGLVLRFRAERQILANLEHPNIARLIGGGMTGDGLPYLVMEYVDGIPIVEYCRNRKLSTEERLELFRTVCHAVEYAHSHLVVHRDIKPGNILVTKDSAPKLLDFGIAKLLDVDVSRADGPTLLTERLMTPDYASPEQILGKQITTATDVYALGVLLYEILCGVRPFGNEARDPLEVARLICSETPGPPSAIALSNAEMPPAEARKVKGDLDNVVLMAIRKEPARRYASVAQLASDIQAYLDGRPLVAAADSWRYRAGKFARRHKTGVAAAALVVITLAGFSVGMGWLARRATREQLKSDQEEQFMAGMFQAATPEEAQGRTITARDLLDRGARRVAHDLTAQPEVRAAMLDNIASAYRSLGIFDQAQVLVERAYELRKQILGANAAPTIESLEGVAELYRDQGQYAQAEPLLRRVLAAREGAFAASDPLRVQTMGNLGENLYWEDKNDEAEAILRKALALDQKLGGTNYGADVRNYLALVVERRSSFTEASQLLSQAAEISRRVRGPDSPDFARTMHNLSSALIDSGDLPEAEEKLRETAAIKRKILGNDHPELALTLNNLAFVLLEEGNVGAAEPVARETLRIWSKNYGERHQRVAIAYGKLGAVLEAEGDYKQAETYYRHALDILSEVDAPKWMSASMLENMDKLELDRHNFAGAEMYAQQSLSLRRKSGGDDDPGLASSLIEIGLARELAGYSAQAETPLRQAFEIRKAKLPLNHPAVMEAEIRLGEALTTEGKPREAEPLLLEADAIAHHPPVHLLPWQLAEADSALGGCLAALGEPSGAAALLERSKAGLRMHPRAAIRKMALARAGPN